MHVLAVDHDSDAEEGAGHRLAGNIFVLRDFGDGSVQQRFEPSFNAVIPKRCELREVVWHSRLALALASELYSFTVY